MATREHLTTRGPSGPVACARLIAEAAHGDDLEPSGARYIDHVARVARRVPPHARVVAWLHDVLEWTALSAADLEATGLAPDELAAVLMLVREGPDTDAAFLDHVLDVARAPGRAGALARTVKRADMTDRARNPRNPAGAWRPPYATGLRMLAAHAASGPDKEKR